MFHTYTALCSRWWSGNRQALLSLRNEDTITSPNQQQQRRPEEKTINPITTYLAFSLEPLYFGSIQCMHVCTCLFTIPVILVLLHQHLVKFCFPILFSWSLGVCTDSLPLLHNCLYILFPESVYSYRVSFYSVLLKLPQPIYLQPQEPVVSAAKKISW